MNDLLATETKARNLFESRMTLEKLFSDIGDVIVRIDKSTERFRTFQPGVGPYGEPQLVKLVAAHLKQIPKYGASLRTMRTPDLLIPDSRALEFKIARPFGDNGKEAENWAINLLHPYVGNVSSLGDCQKLAKYRGPEKRAVIVVGYEPMPPVIDLTLLVRSFEAIAEHVLGLNFSPRITLQRTGLVHPVHQSVRLFAWEVLDRVM
ncbi:MAG: hypothetical protein DMG76_37105 [Acidobacteria bacterium]|nr:MAG: hypothetical protein DMG76_37105 [Acidobacteriota bacterium]